MLRLLALLAPIGAALFVAFASLTPYHAMDQIGAMMGESHVVDLPNYHWIGQVGLIVFGVGFICAISSHDSSNRATNGLFVGSAIAFGFAFVLAGYGIWSLRSAFIDLATAESIEPVSFLTQVHPAKIPLLAGGLFVFAGGSLLSFAARISRGRRRSLRWHNLILACACALVLLLASVWSIRSYQSTDFALHADGIEPARIAEGVMGLIRSSFLSLLGIAGCAVAAIVSVTAAESSRPID